MYDFSKDNNKGVGINLRLEVIDEILKTKPELGFVEIIGDNWLSAGAHHNKLLMLREYYPLSVHCVGMNLAGEDAINFEYLSEIKKIKNSFGAFQVSDHLCFQAHEGVHHHDLLPFAYTEKKLKRVCERVSQIQDYLGEELLIENLSSYLKFKSSEMTEMDFLNELLVNTGAFLLLDLNNIHVNHLNGVSNFSEDVNKINWEKVKEVHVAGPEIIDGIYVDTHGSGVSDELCSLLALLKEKLVNLPVIYERDSNLSTLDEFLFEVQKIKRVLNE